MVHDRYFGPEELPTKQVMVNDEPLSFYIAPFTPSTLSLPLQEMALPYLEIVIGLLISIYLFETYLNIRMLAAYKLRTPPKSLKGLISQEKFEKSRAYKLDRSYFGFVRQGANILVDIGILYFGLFPWFWKKSGELLAHMGLNADNEIIHSLAFYAGTAVCSKISDLPFSLYSTFVIEAKHGLNNRTVCLFFRDIFTNIAVEILVASPILSAVIVIVHKGGPYLSIYLWGAVFVSLMVTTTLYPILIAPLFNKFTPLPAGELRQEIEMLAASLKFPLKNLYVADGSTRSNHSNAYFYGYFGGKYVVIYDTMIQQNKTVEETVAVIAHEFGHWKLRHTLYHLIYLQVYLFLPLGGYTLVRNSKDFFRSFGFETPPVLIGIKLFMFAGEPLFSIVSFGGNIISRSFEFQADAFAKKLGYAKALKDALVRMEENNLYLGNSDPWYNAYHRTHPTLAERLAALDDGTVVNKGD